MSWSSRRRRWRSGCEAPGKAGRSHEPYRRGMVVRGISPVYPSTMTKVLISLPEDLLAAIDREADARGLSRSAFLRAAAEHELRWRNPARVMAALARGQAAMAGLGPADAAEEIARTRRERTERDRRL